MCIHNGTLLKLRAEVKKERENGDPKQKMGGSEVDKGTDRSAFCLADGNGDRFR